MATKKSATKTKKRTSRRKVGAVRHTAKRHVAKRRSTRRSKMGAISPTVEIILGAVAGSFVTRVIENNLPAPTNSTSTDLRPYTGLLVGAAAEFLGKKNLLVRSMGIGAIVEGARSIIDDKYIPSFTSAKTAGLPYTTAHVGNKRMMRLMGLSNSLAGNQQVRSLAATSTASGLAGTKGINVFGYDGVF